MDYQDLKRISDSVGERSGWDLSRVRDERDPVPWDYAEIARRYLRPEDRVLDIGTGGGEVFLDLATGFGAGVGIDFETDQVRVARENAEKQAASRVSFEAMDGRALRFADASFDAVLNRHAPTEAGEVARVLRPGGAFVTQQVGRENTKNVCSIFGFDPAVEWPEDFHDVHLRAQAFREAGCEVMALGEYNVGYRFLDVGSFVFWLKAVPIPFDPERDWRKVREVIDLYGGPRGIETNEHRELLIVRKR